MKARPSETDRILRQMQDILREDLARAKSTEKRKSLKARIYQATESRLRANRAA